ncbi:MAG: hypothetical protein QOE45_1046 [Frankiaceae bacterium]|jgi:hypothetical protein|nr:hypothetical protein [Frankiaceae bacterium]
MAPQVTTHTLEDLVASREALLSSLDVSDVAEADKRAEAGDLTGEQWLLLDALHDVEFLIGGGE